jgi:hypothetical protein
VEDTTPDVDADMDVRIFLILSQRRADNPVTASIPLILVLLVLVLSSMMADVRLLFVPVGGVLVSTTAGSDIPFVVVELIVDRNTHTTQLQYNNFLVTFRKRLSSLSRFNLLLNQSSNRINSIIKMITRRRISKFHILAQTNLSLGGVQQK